MIAQSGEIVVSFIKYLCPRAKRGGMEKNMKKKNVLNALYPISKIISVICFTSIALLWKDWVFGYCIVLPITVLLSIICGIFKSYIKKLVACLILFVGFILIFKLLLMPAGDIIVWQWNFIKIYDESLASGLKLTSSITAFCCLLLLFFDTTSMEDFMLSLQKLGLSPVGTYVFLSTIQMIPDMTKKSKIIMQAQRARGIETEGNIIIRTKAFFPTLGPLIISSISDLEDRATTLESRAFSAQCKKTSLRIIESQAVDKVISIISVLAVIIFIAWRYFL